jgi:hypothetical protein
VSHLHVTRSSTSVHGQQAGEWILMLPVAFSPPCHPNPLPINMTGFFEDGNQPPGFVSACPERDNGSNQVESIQFLLCDIKCLLSAARC